MFWFSSLQPAIAVFNFLTASSRFDLRNSQGRGDKFVFHTLTVSCSYKKYLHKLVFFSNSCTVKDLASFLVTQLTVDSPSFHRQLFSYILRCPTYVITSPTKFSSSWRLLVVMPKSPHKPTICQSYQHIESTWLGDWPPLVTIVWRYIFIGSVHFLIVVQICWFFNDHVLLYFTNLNESQNFMWSLFSGLLFFP